MSTALGRRARALAKSRRPQPSSRNGATQRHHYRLANPATTAARCWTAIHEKKKPTTVHKNPRRYIAHTRSFERIWKRLRTGASQCRLRRGSGSSPASERAAPSVAIRYAGIPAGPEKSTDCESEPIQVCVVRKVSWQNATRLGHTHAQQRHRFLAETTAVTPWPWRSYKQAVFSILFLVYSESWRGSLLQSACLKNYSFHGGTHIPVVLVTSA